MATELGSQIPFFLNTFLSKPASALPKGCLWVLSFDGSYLTGNEKLISENQVVPVTAILNGTQYEPGEWNIQKGLETLLARDYQQTKGCLFAHNVEIPGEATVANAAGLQYNGFIRTQAGGGRSDFASLNVSFLETNVSFVDNVIRPWVIATGHLGLIAQPGRDNYRCNISVYKLGVNSAELGSTPYVAGKYTFFGACPVDVGGEEYSYMAPTSPVYRRAMFIYHYYTFSSGITNPAITKNTVQPIPLSTSKKGANVKVAQAIPVQQSSSIVPARPSQNQTIRAGVPVPSQIR